MSDTIDPATRPEEFDLRLVGMALYRNGRLFNAGAGAAALGHPANVAWLVNKFAELGESPGFVWEGSGCFREQGVSK